MVSKRGIRLVLSFSVVCFFLTNCGSKGKKITRTSKVYNAISSDNSAYKDPFGSTWLGLGCFLKNKADSVETGMWEFIKEGNPQVITGDFDNGLPVNEWISLLAEGWLTKSSWSIYDNKAISVRFSLPFAYEETKVTSSIFKVKTVNDSLGRISIIYGVYKKLVEDDKRAQYDSDFESWLANLGFRFTREKREIRNAGSTYYFNEFTMKDSANNNVKCYQISGNLPSKKAFVEVSFFHMGPREELVKVIFNMIVNHMYIGDERFYNPYLKLSK
jgi:hypothetical protein